MGLLLVTIVALAAGCDRPPTSTVESTPISVEATPTVPATSTPPHSPTLAPTATSLPGSPTPPPAPTPTPARTIDSPPTPALPGPVAGTVPAPAATPSATASPTPTPVPPGTFPDAPDRDLYELARSLLLKSDDPIPRTVNPSPVSYAEGRQDSFWVTDLDDIRAYVVQATLRLVTPHAYWYVEEGTNVRQRDLERASGVFEEEIYPALTAIFGTEWTPGVDNDPHLTILHARLTGAAGYFSSVDEYPQAVHPHSNQREMVYINSRFLRVGSRGYLAVLAHELLHLIHWNGDRTEETWVNEGLAEVASSVAGYRPISQDIFLGAPTSSAVNWPLDGSSTVHYGAASLFFDYLASHYGTRDDLLLLVEEPADGIQGVNSYLAGLGYSETFRDVFKDWTVANFLDEPGDGAYSYPGRDIRIAATARIGEFGEMKSSIPQYSAEYTSIDIIRGDVKIRFQGQPENSLLPTSVEEGGCWWSNRGDSISSTLTRALDLSGVDKATLKFRTWFDVEEDWDYGYLQVSTDGGSTWDIIQAPGTSPRNPTGNSFGYGYTGRSDGWLQKEVDLTPYAGRQVLFRFHYVTDEAINGIGLCFDDISVPEVDFVDAGQGDQGWRAEGFLRIDNRVPQDYIVQVIEVGEQVRVREIELDESKRGEVVVRGLENMDEVVVVTAALASKTLQEAGYTITVEPAS